MAPSPVDDVASTETAVPDAARFKMSAIALLI